MRVIKSYIIKLISLILGLLSSCYLFISISSLFGHDTFTNLLIFAGAYFTISILLILFWCCSLKESTRLKIESYEEFTFPFTLPHFPIVFIISALNELRIKINKINAPD